MGDKDTVLQLKIELLGSEPSIWRRIEVPGNCTFWDLHVAIQDSMGWLDSHLHAFRVVGREGTIGVPDEDFEGPSATAPGWELLVRDLLSRERPVAEYEYDFGDSWLHEVSFEECLPRTPNVSYPRCTDGARRCPPEDCGGVPGYEEFLVAIAGSSHPEHDSMLEWVGGEFDPESFEPSEVRFDDPRKRIARRLG